MCRYLVLVTVLLSPLTSLAADPPAPPNPDYPLVDVLKPTAESAARDLWQPMAGSDRVGVAQAGGRPVLRLPCRFAGNRIDRASWDAPVKLDLTTCQGLQFQLYCDDLAPISSFTLYCQSGDGWYGGEFALEETGRWVTITIDKHAMHTEGRPAGWSKVRTIRFSAWRGQEINTTLYLADFGLVGADAPVVLVRDSSGSRERPQSRDLPATLQRLCVPYLLVHPDEFNAAVLKGRSLLILSQSEPLPEPAAQAAADFAKASPVLALKASAGTLAGANVTTLASFPNESGPFVELLNKTAPKVASEAVADCLERVGQFGPYRSREEAAAGIRQVAGSDAKVKAAVAESEKLSKQASESALAGNLADAVTTAVAARKALLDAYCSAQQPAPGEQRLFWCHDAFGVKGMEWDEAVKILAENGFTGVIPNMCWAGVAYYKSDVLPVAPEVATRGDQIEKCLAACKKYGIGCHVWKVNWNMSARTPADFLKRMKDAGRTQVRFDGSAEERWLCPSSLENRQLEIDSMVEVATKYDVAGIHFDYIRYPDAEACFCPRCREQFEKGIGRKVAIWPADVRKDPELREKWFQFRRDNITPVVAAVAEAVHKNRPGVKVSAAVWPFWTTERDSIGQDWKLWCERGHMDFVCPMDYRPSSTQFRNMVRLQKGWAGKVPCYPGMGESLWDHDICRLIEQIKITRELNTGGFTVFNYAEPEARELLPLCGKGITRKEPQMHADERR